MDLWAYVEQEEKIATGEDWEPWRHQQFSEPPQMVTMIDPGWADGDTSPAALERLAVLVLDDLKIFKLGGVPYFYNVTTTAIIGTHIICVCDLVSSVKRFFGGTDDTPATQYDADDVD